MILKSNGRYLQVTILQRSYAEAVDFEDANWLVAEVKIKVPGFNGLYGTNLRTDDFERFYKSLKRLEIDQSGEIEFTTVEEGIYLKGLLDVTGNIIWEGIAKSSWGESRLTFRIESDYTSVNSLLIQVQEILEEYPVIEVKKDD